MDIFTRVESQFNEEIRIELNFLPPVRNFKNFFPMGRSLDPRTQDCRTTYLDTT